MKASDVLLSAVAVEGDDGADKYDVVEQGEEGDVGVDEGDSSSQQSSSLWIR